MSIVLFVAFRHRSVDVAHRHLRLFDTEVGDHLLVVRRVVDRSIVFARTSSSARSMPTFS
jgi:hypothetical protein